MRRAKLRILPAEIADAIISRRTPGARLPGELHEIVKPFVEEWRAVREAEVVGAARGSVRAPWDGGVGNTLEAASDGRVDTLLHQSDCPEDAYRCPKCGRAAVGGTTCRWTERPWSHGTTGSASPSADARARRRRARRRHRRDLDPVDGIGAILRY
jgi:hypothetical protein